MSMLAVGDRLLVTNHLRLEEACEVRPPLTSEETASWISPVGLVTLCANCRKTRRADKEAQWDWIPEMLLRDPFKVTHGLCPRCLAHLYG
jgi:hypothetical protein